MSSSTIDSGNPWLGLASFSEETQQYFYGREDEVGDLTRRIQRKLLTVLFGQSGLGKTSILRAGIVPRLRAQGYCPVYVRVDYGPNVPSASEQIKQGIISATADAGSWTRSGSAREGESLWEFLHHRGDVLLDAQGKPVIPLLIFDQFEEIFTLAQTDDAGRAHAAHFMAALAELVENRAPPELEARLEVDDEAATDFDFGRSDYRVLISLREDYLAHLESLKSAMPSITQNRMRLAPMTGLQALSAVTGPGGTLVSNEVAEAIVRFVAGGAELANAQIEPSLLSLICRELNDKRIQAGRDEISMDLLAGSHASILTDFYERSLADQPASVRRVVEDVLLTDSGYRENVAEERVANALAAANAAPGTLALLVNRRLLRIEDRLDIRRVELTHDVLCSVVGASREQRHEREQQAAAERALEEKREREQASYRSLIKARKVMAACAVLAGVAVASAAFGYIKLRESQETREIAETSQAAAEQLMRYLVDDFFSTLGPIGRVDLQYKLAERTNAYYTNLPVSSRTEESEQNRGLALLRLGGSLRANQGANTANGTKALEQAVSHFEQLSTSQPGVERIELSLARALHALGTAKFADADYDLSVILLDRAVKVAAPFGSKADSPIAARLVYTAALARRGHSKVRFTDYEAARIDLEETIRLATAGGAVESNDNMALTYLTVAASLNEVLRKEGKGDPAQAEKIQLEAKRVGAKLLSRSPQYASAVTRAVGSFAIGSGVVAVYTGFPGKALELFRSSSADLQSALRKDPSMGGAVDSLSIHHGFEGRALLDLGRTSEALAKLRASLDPYRAVAPSAFHSGNLSIYAYSLSELEYDLGLDQEAANSRAKRAELVQKMINLKAQSAKSRADVLSDIFLELGGLELKMPFIDLGDAEQQIASIRARLKGLDSIPVQLAQKKESDSGSRAMRLWLLYLESIVAEKKSDNERVARLLIDLVREGTEPFEWLYLAQSQNRYAKALINLQRPAEAKAVMASAIAGLNAKISQGSDSQILRRELARAFLVGSMAGDDARGAQLEQAALLVEQMPVEMRSLRSIHTLSAEIVAAMKKRGMAPSPKLTSAARPLQS
ncbi:MAG: hypothetical protein V4723_09240 [Pseudomonadota bacterium]